MIEVEGTVRAHMTLNQRCSSPRLSAAVMRSRQPALGEHVLKHQGVDIHQTRLEQVKREHGDFLIFEPIARDFAALTEEDEAIRAVPVLDDVQSFMDFAPERFGGEIAAQKDGLCRLAQFRQRLIRRVLDVALR